MNTEKVFAIVLRLALFPISMLALINVLSIVLEGINGVVYYYAGEEYDIWIHHNTIRAVGTAVSLSAGFTYLTLEILATFVPRIAKSRILTHFRFGPIITL